MLVVLGESGVRCERRAVCL